MDSLYNCRQNNTYFNRPSIVDNVLRVKLALLNVLDLVCVKDETDTL